MKERGGLPGTGIVVSAAIGGLIWIGLLWLLVG